MQNYIAETTLFRISRDFLALRSPIFGDMLSIPTPENAETMEGCPIVRLPDSANDITYFLKALLYSEFFEPFPAPTSFPIIAGVLRMSHKYEVDVLRKRALIHFASRLPTTLQNWGTWGTWSPEISSHYLEAILLARQTSALWILPAACYSVCSRVEIGNIIIGLDGHRDSLKSTDVVTCARGVRYLDTTATSKIFDSLWSRTISGCENPLRCAEERRAKRLEAEIFRAFELGDVRPPPNLHFLEARHFEHLVVTAVCRVCKSHSEAANQAARQSLWDRLPELFNLPPWAELEQMKAEALK
ncbi:hypothetical protein C8F04DRAFT_1322547 [Mycena alexandri]|uniref:BTB domain-containing protein n=1 Tax=Mycena alexandri TaxID=1745969 RepID=A0AAD6XI74_9AGAR|nr:hypothetical protein C8F04DRAFT_1322547 [Mycena alexandri]